MALLEQFGEPKRSYYEGQTQAGDGWKLVWENERLWIKGQISFRRQQEKREKDENSSSRFMRLFHGFMPGGSDWMPHPVIYMGKAISALEKFLRRRFPDTQKGLLMAGAALAAILPLGSFLMAAAAIYLAGLVHPVLAFLLETLWCWQALAVKGLYTESMRVKKKLEEQGPARRQERGGKNCRKGYAESGRSGSCKGCD